MGGATRFLGYSGDQGEDLPGNLVENRLAMWPENGRRRMAILKMLLWLLFIYALARGAFWFFVDRRRPH